MDFKNMHIQPKSLILSLFLMILLIPISKTRAQETENKSSKKNKNVSTYFEFGVGMSIPQTNTKSSPYGKGVGYSHIGVVTDFNAVMRIKKFWGIKYNISTIICQPDKEYILNNSNYGYKNNVVGSWVNIHLGFSPFVRLKKDKYSFEFGISTGLLSSSVPVVKHLLISENKVLYTKNLHSGFGLGFSIMPNIAAYYKLSKKHDLKLFLSYLISSINIKYNDLLLDKYEVKHILSNLNVGVGISF
jgi:hypothetical protein